MSDNVGTAADDAHVREIQVQVVCNVSAAAATASGGHEWMEKVESGMKKAKISTAQSTVVFSQTLNKEEKRLSFEALVSAMNSVTRKALYTTVGEPLRCKVSRAFKLTLHSSLHSKGLSEAKKRRGCW